MVDSHKALVCAIAATSLLWMSGTASAEDAVLIPGATVFKRINPIYPIVATSYPSIGLHFHDDPNPQVVDYSQNALASDRAIQDGVQQSIIAVRQNSGDVVIIGESMGSMVAWRVATELAATSDVPPPGDVRVVLIAPPEAGVAEYFTEGTYIPLLNYRIARIAESPYDTTVVIGEYDGWADPPDRPWNLVSSANALLGTAFVHGPPSFTADVSGLEPEIDGNVTTYLVPTEHLPLTQVFRDVGVPNAIVDKADDVLRPVVDAGYVRHDEPGDSRPYLSDGAIHRNVQSQQQARETSQDRGAIQPGAGRERLGHRNELRQAIRGDLRDRVKAGFGQVRQRIAAIRPARAPRT